MTALKNMLNESVRENNVRESVREVNVTSISNTESKKVDRTDFETSSAEKIERAFSPPQESNDSSWNGFSTDPLGNITLKLETSLSSWKYCCQFGINSNHRNVSKLIVTFPS